MTPAEREAFYDAEIAPALRALGARCQANGLSFLAAVEWEPGETGKTFTTSPPVGLPIRWAELAIRCNGNVDALIFALMKDARKVGHGSICLSQLGVPTTPCVDGQPSK